MSDKRNRYDNDEIEIGLPETEHPENDPLLKRDLEMFEDYLNGMTKEAIAAKYGKSRSLVFHISKRDSWDAYKLNSKEKEMRKIAKRVEEEKLFGAIGPGHPKFPGGWVRIGIRLGAGTKHPFIIPPDPRTCRLIAYDPATGEGEMEILFAPGKASSKPGSF